jgi:hypothetical protein
MVPKHKTCDTGNSDVPKRKCKVLSLSKKAKALSLIGKYMAYRIWCYLQFQASIAGFEHILHG